MPNLEWRFDRGSSRFHRLLSSLLIGSFGGATLLLLYGATGFTTAVILGGGTHRPLALAVVGLLVGGLAAVHAVRGLRVWPVDVRGFRRLVVASMVGAVWLSAAATVSFDAALVAFGGVFVPAALVRGTCRSAGSVDTDTGRVTVNGRTTSTGDIVSIRTLSVLGITVVRFEPAADADEALRMPFVCSTETAREVRALLEPEADG
ncbi:hypothetical protein [Haloarchaeobius salinus]|uniref:hypothetical protein n=1 Tax=Haloarchaeobius salinus TaxID=1198298 RepID=UPI002108B957|nr:hypothetical protein [Haloarchaeobius salinus]